MSIRRRISRFLFVSIMLLFGLAVASCTITFPSAPIKGTATLTGTTSPTPAFTPTATNTPVPPSTAPPTPTAAVLPPETVVPTPLPGPTIQLVDPTGNTQLAQGQQLVVQSLANAPAGVDHVQLWVDGALYATVSNPTPSLTAMAAAQSWNSTAIGAHTLTVAAYDLLGRASTPVSLVVTVTGNTTPPTVWIDQPGAPTGRVVLQVGDVVTIGYGASDANRVTRTELWVDGQIYATDTYPASSPNVHNQHTWSSNTIGDHTFFVRAYNIANQSSDSALLTIGLADRNPPDISLDSPNDGDTLRSDQPMEVRVSASDSKGVTHLALRVDDNVVATWDSDSAIGESSVDVKLVWQSPTAGSHEVRIQGSDSVGLSTTTNHITVNLVAPTATFTPAPPAPTPTATFTPLPTATPTTAVLPPETVVAPTATFTPAPPPATDTPLPPTATFTPLPAAPTDTPLPPAATATPAPPTPTDTPLPPTATFTPLPPATDTPVPPPPTATPAPPTPTFTPMPPTPTDTFTPPPTATAIPPTATFTPLPPATDTPVPPTVLPTIQPPTTDTPVPPPPTDTPAPPPATATPVPPPTTAPQAPQVISLIQDEQRVTLNVGDQFLLNLDTNYKWKVAVKNESIVNHNEQGIYTARRSGDTTLIAVGKPACQQGQPECKQPSLQYRLEIKVK